MDPNMKARAVAGFVAVVAGVALLGANGAALTIGWGVWAAGLFVLLSAVPSAGEPVRQPDAWPSGRHSATSVARRS
jgi:hypothetical protein